MAHWKHSPVKVQGPYTIEASVLKALHIYPQSKHLQVDVEVENGSYTTEVGAAVPNAANMGSDTAASSGIYSDKDRSRTYTVTVTTGGALGTAQASWTTDKGDDGGGPVTVPASGIVGIGTKGVQLTFTTGPDGVLSLNNKWTIACTRTFQSITILQQLVTLRGNDYLSIATATPDAAQSTVFGVVAVRAYASLGAYLGWTGSIMALDEL